MSNQANISKHYFRLRYGVRHLLLLMTVVAVGLFGYQQYRTVQQARENYDYVFLGWENDFVTREDVVEASESLRTAEVEAVWISDRTAQQRHIERLAEFVKAVENAQLVTMYSTQEGHDQAEKFIEETKRLVEEHGARASQHL